MSEFVKHMVFLRPKPGSYDRLSFLVSNLQKFTESEFPHQISHFKTHNNTSEENLSNGFCFGFSMICNSKSALEDYLQHPSHINLAKQIIAELDLQEGETEISKAVLVFDYVVPKPAVPVRLAAALKPRSTFARYSKVGEAQLFVLQSIKKLIRRSSCTWSKQPYVRSR